MSLLSLLLLLLLAAGGRLSVVIQSIVGDVRDAIVVVDASTASQLTRVRIEGYDVDPRIVSLPPANDAPFVQRIDGDQIVFAAGGDIFAVGRPTAAEQAAEIRLHRTDEFHGIEVEDA